MVSENETNAAPGPSAQPWNEMIRGYVPRMERVIPSFKNLNPFLRRRKQSIRQGEPPKVSPPSPLPQKRNRALTLPLPKVKLLSLRRQFYTNAQLDSLFMIKFPIEIRYMIYDRVFCGENEDLVIHIFAQKSRRLAHSCWSPDQGVHVVFIPGKCENHTKDGFLSLLLTCRAIYSEAIVLLYSTATFLFFRPMLLTYFARTILPQRLDSIRTLTIYWERSFWSASESYARAIKAEKEWIEAWQLIAAMKHLQRLRVGLQRREFETAEARRKVVEPMMSVVGPRIFELVLPLEDEGHWSFLEGAPFKIVSEFSNSN